MYEHLVSFKFKEDVTLEKQQELGMELLKLKGEIPGIIELTTGINKTQEVENAQGYTLGLRITFQDKEALDNYLPHPRHQEFIASLDGLIENVIVVDYEVAW